MVIGICGECGRKETLVKDGLCGKCFEEKALQEVWLAEEGISDEKFAKVIVDASRRMTS